MNDLENSRHLLVMAQKDLKTLRILAAAADSPDETFGFHAQQATEKCLKAWLSALMVIYPLQHDLARLLDLLASHGQVVAGFESLVALTPYAVQFRYEECDDEPLDRTAVYAEVETLYGHVTAIVARGDGSDPTPESRA